MNGLFLAASGAASQVQALDISAYNLANASTPGFRRFELEAQAVSSAPSPYEYAAVPASAPPLDMSQGPLRETGNPLAQKSRRTATGWATDTQAHQADGNFAIGEGDAHRVEHLRRHG